MEEDDNVPKDMIEEDGIGTVDKDSHDNGTSASDNVDEDGLDIPILKKTHEPLNQGSQNFFSLCYTIFGELEGYEWFI